jgi:hypothetical protein
MLIENRSQSLGTGESGETPFSMKHFQKIFANHWRTGETRDTRLLEQGPVRLEIFANHWPTGETRETRLLKQGPARLGNLCQSSADRRDRRDKFIEARSG